MSAPAWCTIEITKKYGRKETSDKTIFFPVLVPILPTYINQDIKQDIKQAINCIEVN